MIQNMEEIRTSINQILDLLLKDSINREFVFVTWFGDIVFKETNTGCVKMLQLFQYYENNSAYAQNNGALDCRLCLLAKDWNSFETLMKRKYTPDSVQETIYEDILLREGLYDEIIEKRITKEDHQIYFARQYSFSDDNLEHVKVMSINEFLMWALKDVQSWRQPRDIWRDEAFLTDLIKMDRIEDTPSEYIQKLYWAYGNETRNLDQEQLENKLYECSNLMVLDISVDTGATYLNERITKLNSLRILRLNTVHGMSLSFINRLSSLTNLSVLELTDNALVDIPKHLDRIPFLASLYLSQNPNISNWDDISSLFQLHRLELQGNNIDDPHFVSSLRKLEVLDLSYNRIETLQDSCSSLENLKVLDLRHNLLEYVPKVILKMKKLEVLYLSHNSLKELPTWLCGMTHLKELHLENTGLTSLPDDIISMKGVKILDLRQNYFHQLPNALSQFKKRALKLEKHYKALFDPKVAEALGAFDMSGHTFMENDFNLKLMVIQKLMYDQKVLLPKFEFNMSSEAKELDKSDEYGPLNDDAVAYFKELKIPNHLLFDIHTLDVDPSDEVYNQVYPHWDGEDENLFQVKSISDLAMLPSLKVIDSPFFEKLSLVDKKNLKKRKIKLKVNY